jgi:hypothetical protein
LSKHKGSHWFIGDNTLPLNVIIRHDEQFSRRCQQARVATRSAGPRVHVITEHGECDNFHREPVSLRGANELVCEAQLLPHSRVEDSLAPRGERSEDFHHLGVLARVTGIVQDDVVRAATVLL